MSASYCAVEPITLATDGMAKSASGAAGRSSAPTAASAAAETAHVTRRLTSTTKTEYVKTSSPGEKGTVMRRSWMSE